MKFTAPWLTKKRTRSGRVGLAVGPDGLAIVHLDQAGTLLYCQFHSQPGDQHRLLSELASEHGWQGIPCSVVLHPVYYQLLLAETPPVQAEEMSSAVRWLVKELLDYPLDEAAIEHFTLPSDAYRGRQKMLYAAALRKKTLQSLVEPAQSSGLDVDCVEIAELAMHNITARLPPVSGAAALVQLYEGEGFINLVENGAVYLCRRLDVGLERLSAESADVVSFETLLLEIQRSLDYYESQLGKGIVTTLYYSPGSAELAPLGKYLSDQLGLNISPLSLQSLNFATGDSNEAQLLSCIGAIGAALGPLPEPEAASAAS
jgi:MSHA biogenesis protein MshI